MDEKVKTDMKPFITRIKIMVADGKVYFVGG